MIAFKNTDFATGDLSGWIVKAGHSRGSTGVTKFDLVEGYPVMAAFAEISLDPGNHDSEQLEITQDFTFPEDGHIVVSANIAAVAFEPADQVSFATIIDGGTFGVGQVPFSPPPSALRDRISSVAKVAKGSKHSIGFRWYASVNAPASKSSRRAAGYLGKCSIVFLPCK